MFVINSLTIAGLSPVSFELHAGDCVGLSGDSGCGKSRLMRAIADMDEHQGSASLDGEAAENMPAHLWRKQVGLLPAESQWWCDSVGEHFPHQNVDVSVLGFEPAVYDWEVSRCSSGEKQRLGILRCLANEPRVLLLDEPTANLDPDNTIKVEQLVKAYIDKHNACCIWVSHNRLQLQRIASRCYEFIDKQLVEAAA